MQRCTRQRKKDKEMINETSVHKDKMPEGFDEKYMRMAIDIAKLGTGRVNPNPLVGAVIVKDGRVISRGYHAAYGGLHAERAAFANLLDKEAARGADLYVTLEPCCHYGKQPPCTEAVVEYGIARVFVGSFDPNPMVSGKGLTYLREHGIEVYEHILEKECDALNAIFFYYIQKKRPYVILKYAMTMDGKIATYSGKSRWITGEEARKQVHLDRKRCAAIMVGIVTVLRDDPMLNCRVEDGVDPIRIVCDSKLQIPLESKLVQTAKVIPTWIAAVRQDPDIYQGAGVVSQDWKAARLEEKGCRILYVEPDEGGHVRLESLMELLGAEKVDSVLLEGGAGLHEAALRSGVVQKVQAYIAPKLFGGRDAPSPVGGAGVEAPDQAWRLTTPRIRRLGDDILLESDVIYLD